jgi:hypothetical protein
VQAGIGAEHAAVGRFGQLQAARLLHRLGHGDQRHQLRFQDLVARAGQAGAKTPFQHRDGGAKKYDQRDGQAQQDALAQ